MFEKLRESAHRRRVLAVLIFGAIILVFALFNYHPSMGTGPAYAARVNSQIISVADYKQAFDQTMGFYSQLFGGGQLPPDQMQRIRQEVMDQLVQREAVTQAAEKYGFVAGNEEVVDLIRSAPVFQENGVFKRELYDNFLRARGMQAGQFEEKLRRDMAAAKIRDAFNMGMQPSALELERLMAMRKETLEIEFARIETEVQDTNKASKADVEKFLATPEGLKATQDYHAANSARFTRPEELRARHILIKFNPGDKAGEQKALEKIQAAQEQVKTKSFAEVAKAISEDTGSKEQGGDLGFFPKGRMVPAFEEAAFAAEIGKVTQPVKTDFGYHLIKVEEKRPGKTANFEEDKLEAAKFAFVQSQVQSRVTALREALAKGDAASANKLVQELGGKWTSTGVFSLADQTIPSLGDEDVYFSEAAVLTKEAPLSKNLIAQGPSFVVMKLKAKGGADPKRDAELATKESAEQWKQRLMVSRTREVFDKWMAKTMEGAKIERNTEVLR